MTSKHGHAKLFLLVELFPRPVSVDFHRGGSVKGVFESRSDALAVVAQDADAVADGHRFFIVPVEAEEAL